MTSSMVTSYTAPSPGSTPAITSFLAPTPTVSEPNSNGGSGTTPGSSSGTPLHTSGSPFGSGNSITAIALGTIFGVLGLVAGGLVTIYYMRRTRNRDRRTTNRFLPLTDDPEGSSSDGPLAGATPEAAHHEDQHNEIVRKGGITDILAHLGISKYRSVASQPRKDMFVDEDRSFGAGHLSTMQRQDSERASVWSLRSVSALVRGMIGSEPSGSGADQGDHEWKKTDHLREDAQEGLIRQGSFRSNFSSHPVHQKDRSFWSYTDPFEDPIPDDDYDDIDLSLGIAEKDADYERSVLRSDEAHDLERTALGPLDSVWPSSVRSRTLTPLREASHISLSDPSDSLPSPQESPHVQTKYSHADKPTLSPPASISLAPHSPTASRSSEPQGTTTVSRYSIVSGSTLSHSQSMTRPDSWWSRLTKPPLLDRRTSMISKPLDFRDPTPAPPLVTSDETRKCSPSPRHSGDTPVENPAGHGKSVSSTHSGRTAHTDSVEQLGACYDVVQRLASDGSSSGRAPSLGSADITEQGMFAVEKPTPPEISISGALPHVDPPRPTLCLVDLAIPLDVETPFEPLASQKSNPAPPKTGIVTSRIKAYERRLSQDMESQQIPALRNTRRREEVPSRSRPTIQYGVAPRASLFIANPDLGNIS